MDARLRIRAAWVWPALLGAVVVVVVAAAAVAAIETRTVATYWQGLWWSLSLMTTVGFLGEPPDTELGALLSAFLMLFGFFLLAMVSAALAALFVREEEQPSNEREEEHAVAVSATLARLERRLADIEALLGSAALPDPVERPRGTKDTTSKGGASSD